MKKELNQLKRLGHTSHGDDNGNTVIYMDTKTANIEIIIMEMLFEKLGYKILSEEDFEMAYTFKGKEDRYEPNIAVTTNIPWDLYLELNK